MSNLSTQPKLFQSIQVGNMPLQHRIVLAPMSRMRADETLTPLPIVAEYYSQRASVPGTLLITEGTYIASKAKGFPNIPGIWSEDQIAVWKKVTDGVHAKGSFIFLQIAALGRTAVPALLAAESYPYTSASDVQLSDRDVPPRPLTTDEIAEYVDLFAVAASNAVHKAGFDGVEIYGANGFLVDQFIQDVSNKRTDAYGGSPENRARFALEVVEAVSKAIGSEKTAIRLSPFSPSQGMGETDPKISFSVLVKQLRDLHPKLAYLHLVEPRISGDSDISASNLVASNDFIREIWGSERPLISTGGFDRKKAIALADSSPNSLVAFGRHFTSNPDLPRRLRENIALNPYDRPTFYLPGNTTSLGYTDHPFAEI